MGRWAQRQRRGGSNHQGYLTAPGSTDWTFTSPVAAQLRWDILIPFPAGATHWLWRYHNLAFPTVWTYAAAPISANFAITSATTGQTYEAQICWYAAGAQVSPWSDGKTVVCS